MPRSEDEATKGTYRQLEVFAAADHADSWPDLEHELGLDKHAIIQTIKRLGEKLNLTNLALDENDRPTIPPRFHGLVEEAEAILHHYRVLEEKAVGSGRAYWLRCDAYWSHLTHFMAHAIGDLEQGFPHVHVELAPNFGRHRDRGGAGLLRDLRQGRFDFVVAPDDGPRPDVAAMDLYSWVIVAAVREGHPLLAERNEEEVRLNVLRAERLNRYPIATSPSGHMTRSTIDKMQSRALRFHVDTTSPEPAALVALGRAGNRIPLIASDSVVEKWEPHWPAIVLDGNHLLTGRYYAYFKSDEGPEAVRDAKLVFAQKLYEHSDELRARTRGWTALLDGGAKPRSKRGQLLSE